MGVNLINKREVRSEKFSFLLKRVTIDEGQKSDKESHFCNSFRRIEKSFMQDMQSGCRCENLNNRWCWIHELNDYSLLDKKRFHHFDEP